MQTATTNSAPATVTAPVTVAPQATVTAPATLRAQRVARVQVALHAKHLAAKQAKYQAVTYATKLQAYNAAVAQLAAQMGVTAPAAQPVRTLLGNATNITPKHAPSATTGACATVRTLAAANGYNRKATLAAAAAQGINPATAATQYAIAKKLHQQGAL